MAVATQCTVAEDAGTEAAFAFEPRFGLFVAEGVVHPVAGATFLDTGEANALNLEFLTNHRAQVEANGDDVAASAGGMRVREIQFVAQLLEDLPRKEGDLAFVIFLVAEEPVAANTLTGDAIDFVPFKNRMLAGRLVVVAEEVVAG